MVRHFDTFREKIQKLSKDVDPIKRLCESVIFDLVKSLIGFQHEKMILDKGR